MSIRSYLKKTTAAFRVSALILGASYLLAGWGLSASGGEATYRFFEYWSETGGQAFEEPLPPRLTVRESMSLTSQTDE